MTAKYGTPYFSNYINSDMDPSDVRAMCPLFKEENVLVRDDYSKEFHISKIENLYSDKTDKVYDILLNGEVKQARLHRYDNQTFYRIKTINGQEVILSASHANLVYGGKIKRTDELTTNDYLPFNVVPYEGKGLQYEDGLLVGAFLGDGTLKDDYSVTFSLNETSKQEILASIIDIAVERYGAKYITNIVGENKSCLNLTVTSKMLRGLIEEYVSGKALTKELNAKCIGKSLAFRQGILDGYLATDGNSDKKRIYSASKKAADSFVTMLASMGIPARINVDERDSSETLSDNPIYCVKLYNVETGQRTYGDIYIKEDGYMWFRISEIEKYKTTSKIGYCFEVLNDDEPYFMLPSGLVTHNCRLRLNLRELRRKAGGNFGAGEKTGSIGVVTINLPQIAFLSEDKNDFYKRLDSLMDIAARSLSIKRNTITSLLERNLYPYIKAYLNSFEDHFSTIGLVGMNEACLNAKWLKKNIESPEGKAFAEEVLDHMRERLSDYQEKYEGTLFNLEATPAESTAYRFAKWDKQHFPHIITAGMDGTPYYTNSSHLPVDATSDIFEALDHQDSLQTKYTSGTVFHAFLGERLPDWKSAMKLVKNIAENYHLPYYTMSPTYSVCKEHGYLKGEQGKCPICGKPTEIYSRITGYYRPVQNWNNGKTQEFYDRRTYTGLERTAAEPAPAKETTTDKPNLTIITTKTCPKCKQLKKILDEEGYSYTEVLADSEEGMAICEKEKISEAPTVLYNGNKYSQFKILDYLRGTHE